MKGLFPISIIILFFFLILPAANALVTPKVKTKNIKKDKSELRFLNDCATPQAQVDLSINNVRARLNTGGDMWWNGGDGRYIVPAVDPASGQKEVSAIFASGLWMGGLDPGGNLKLAAQTYGRLSGNNDYWPGPLTDDLQVDAEVCSDWDRFFKVSKKSIELQQANLKAAQEEGRSELYPHEIPEDLKGWPALGNPYFFRNPWFCFT